MDMLQSSHEGVSGLSSLVFSFDNDRRVGLSSPVFSFDNARRVRI